ncbi:hypothetical protein N3K66_008642 [Trichothecium roseum]|uniref:Uncharacterized protein n=1 Tax=Trichothecium roseum TaxID=47278 RepID=A0ACC0UQY7_9HYPO|nr:hypothetical protein N3K66_008642 [Trichothecium roseum]
MSKQSLLLALPLLGLLSAPATSVAAAAATTYPSPGLPMAINTWGGPFTASTDAAFRVLTSSSSPSNSTTSGTKLVLDAAEAGCAACERSQCDGTVGRGGSPDERCETTLDAMIMDGNGLRSGAVAALRRVRDAVSVARAVLDRTGHSMLAGDLATRFAVENGFTEEVDDEGAGLSTPESREACRVWGEDDACQPNYRLNVRPDPSASCGPYHPLDPEAGVLPPQPGRRQASHDTVSLITLAAATNNNSNDDSSDSKVFIASATSTNGAAHKIPGRVGDGPIAGSGSYADAEAGACAATGDGDVMMRFLPCYQAVESMRRGMSPGEAADDAVRRMLARYPDLAAGLVVVDRTGRHAGAACGWTFTYSYRGGSMEETKVVTVEPVNPEPSEL